MERSNDIKVVPTQFDWSDLGSFESVYDYLVQKGHPIYDCGTIVIGSLLHTTFVGEKLHLDLYCRCITGFAKRNSQEVKQVYQQLELKESHLL